MGPRVAPNVGMTTELYGRRSDESILSRTIAELTRSEPEAIDVRLHLKQKRNCFADVRMSFYVSILVGLRQRYPGV